MISCGCVSNKLHLTSLALAASLSLCGQTPPTTNSFVAGNVPPTAPPAVKKTPQISIEMRGDILMARKMYREAIDMYRQGPANSPVLTNKIGIAFHQLQLLDLAKKNYEQVVKHSDAGLAALARYKLGWIAMNAADYKEALANFECAPEEYARLGEAALYLIRCGGAAQGRGGLDFPGLLLRKCERREGDPK